MDRLGIGREGAERYGHLRIAGFGPPEAVRCERNAESRLRPDARLRRREDERLNIILVEDGIDAAFADDRIGVDHANVRRIVARGQVRAIPDRLTFIAGRLFELAVIVVEVDQAAKVGDAGRHSIRASA